MNRKYDCTGCKNSQFLGGIEWYLPNSYECENCPAYKCLKKLSGVSTDKVKLIDILANAEFFKINQSDLSRLGMV